jgi:1-acyl-sn-glycerol-3-phosphate acyltransferase
LFYWVMKHVLVGPLLRLAFRPWTKGVDNVPATGGAILASNHLAVIDSFVLPLVLERRVQFLGKSDYFTGTGLKGRLVAGFMRGVGTIPVDRSGGKASEAALRTGLRVLSEGDLFGIYPEGTRSPDGRLYRGKTGVARLALESGAPVIPVAMVGTDVAQPLGTVIPKPMPIGVVIGEPLDFSRYKGMENDRFVLRSVTDEIMYAILRLSDQEYVDVYAATAKARIAAGLPVDAKPGRPAAAPDTAPEPVEDAPPEVGETGAA